MIDKKEKEIIMTDEAIKEMILDIIGEVDYDICKDYVEETAEESELVENKMQILIDIVKKHLEGKTL